MCAHWERESSRSCGSQLQMHNNKHCKQQPFTCPRLIHISYMKSILEGPWLLGAQGSRLPLPNGQVRPCIYVFSNVVKLLGSAPGTALHLQCMNPVKHKLGKKCLKTYRNKLKLHGYFKLMCFFYLTLLLLILSVTF